MADLVALSGNQEKWRRTLPAGEVTLGRVQEKSALAAPWDKQIHGLHATLTWAKGQLLVRRTPGTVNKIFYRGNPSDEFSLSPGERFVIGTTIFELQESSEATPSSERPKPHLELTVSPEELHKIKFADADERIEALANLPEVIRYSPSDNELESRVVQVLLRGIPRADAAAVIYLDPATSDSGQGIQVRHVARRHGPAGDFQVSRRLVVSAIRRRRQSVMHRWAGPAGESFTVGGNDWAICAPLPDEPSPGFGLFVTGQLQERPTGPSAETLHTSDLKFAELVANLFGALRQVLDLQRRRSMLERFLSRTVLAALAEKDIDEVLKPQPTTVTVLFCDLRGSCRIAEEGETELSGLWERLSEALSLMTGNIIDGDGVVGDFQGDAAMGFWGWPFSQDDQVERAARAALAIRKDFQRVSQKPGHPLQGFACGLGIAHGPAIAGRLGTPDQFKVGVFGPVVNLASRLESMTKLFGVPILVGDAAAAALPPTSHWCRLRRLARIQPAGMAKALDVSELLPPAVEPGSLPERDRRDYEAGLDAFLAGRWADARSLLERLANDGPRDVLFSFMEQHRNSPPQGWEGAIVLDKK